MATKAPADDSQKHRQDVPEHKIYPRIYPNNSPTTRAEKPATRAANKRRVRDAFRRWLLTWPCGNAAQETAARCIWFDDMTEAERIDCIAFTPAFLRSGQRPPAPDVYLRERLWRSLPQAARAKVRAADLVHAPYGGKLWMAGFHWVLLQPAGRIHITGFDRQSVAMGRETEDGMLCRKRAESGWPEAVRMAEAFGQQRKSFCDAALLPATEEFRQAEWGGDVFTAWQRLHALRCWPFPRIQPPDGFVWFPPVADPAAGDLDLQVEAALAAFETRAREIMDGVQGAKET